MKKNVIFFSLNTSFFKRPLKRNLCEKMRPSTCSIIVNIAELWRKNKKSEKTSENRFASLVEGIY
jgi:hypothetical protein